MDISEILKKNQKKVTPERKEVFSYITDKHIFTKKDLTENFSHVSRASIFRIINLFLEIGIIRRVHLGEKTESYEIVPHDHHHEHMRCKKCGKIISFESGPICTRIFEEAKKIGFQIDEHSICILGICKNCL